MTITAHTIRLVSTASDMSGHGNPGLMSDMEHFWAAPNSNAYGLAFDDFTVYGIRDVDDDGEGCYLISICDLGDVEDLRDEAETAGDTDMYELCVQALDGDMDSLLVCVEAIMEAQLCSLDD